MGTVGWTSPGRTLVGIWQGEGVRSLILIYAAAAVRGSPGERGSRDERKCVRMLNRVINLNPPEVNPK